MCATEREHAGVLARAVVLHTFRWVPIRAAFELVLAGRRAGQERADGRELLGAGEMRSARDRQLLLRKLRERATQRQSLQRLRRRAHERDEPALTGFCDDRPVLDGHRMDAV